MLVDDSAAECAEVAAALPEVAVVQLPRIAAGYPNFLQHCWLFDPGFGTTTGSVTTTEDAVRTRLYRQVAERAKAKEEFEGGLPAWVASLSITTRFDPLAAANIERAAQLTGRTSQMNTFKEPIMSAKLAADCGVGPAGMDPATAAGFCVRVKDRFGDHGIVGLVVYTNSEPVADGVLEILTFVLSCRSLHLGVEHAMLRQLAAIATERGATTLRFRWRPSERNDAAAHFFTGIPEALFIDSTESKPPTLECTSAVPAAPTLAPMPEPELKPEPKPEPAESDPASTWMQFMTPELEALSKRQRKKELRRRVRAAQQADPMWKQQQAKARAARRLALRQTVHKKLAPNENEQVSRHKPFPNKPAAGHILVPVATAAALCVGMAVDSVSSRSDSSVMASSGVQRVPSDARPLRASHDNRPVSLHHETVLALATGLAECPAAVDRFVAGLTSNKSVLQEGPLAAVDDEYQQESSLSTFQTLYRLREQARDEVKVMIQRDNPEVYAHVDHTFSSGSTPRPPAPDP